MLTVSLKVSRSVIPPSAYILTLPGTSFIATGEPNKIPGRFPNRPFWPLYVKDKGQLIVFGEGNDERAGGGHTGQVATVEDDTWMEKECEYWWARTEKFEL